VAAPQWPGGGPGRGKEDGGSGGGAGGGQWWHAMSGEWHPWAVVVYRCHLPLPFTLSCLVSVSRLCSLTMTPEKRY